MPDEDKKPVTLADVVKPVETKPEATAEPAAPAEPTIPSKYEGKSPAELAKMLEDAQSMIGKQSAEIGEVRRLADTLIQADVAKRTTTEEPSTSKVELNLDDPDEATAAIQKLVDLRVEEALAGVQGKVQSLEGASLQTRLDREHAGWRDITADQKFVDWVAASTVRTRLAQEGNAGDYDSSAELLSTWKALNPAKPAADTGAEGDTKPDTEAARAEALKRATLETGARASGSSDTVYRRADIMKLRTEDPERYDALRAEIRQAYIDGRVR